MPTTKDHDRTVMTDDPSSEKKSKRDKRGIIITIVITLVIIVVIVMISKDPDNLPRMPTSDSSQPKN